MAEFDHGIKQITDTTARELARVAGLTCERLTPLEGSLPATTELLADRAFRAQQRRERFVVYFEFYTRWDRHAPWDMLAKSGLLSQRLRLPTVCLAFILLPRGFRSPGGQLRLEASGAPTQQLWFREVCLWEQEPEDWWERVPGLMALYPLCRHGQAPAEAIRHAAAAIEQTPADAPGRADQLALLDIFGSLAFPQLDIEGIIGSEKMQESKAVLRWQRRAEVETRREVVADAVRIRFGEEASAATVPLLEQIEDAERLRDLLALAIRCGNFDEFRTGLTAPPPPPRRRTRSANR